MRLGQAIFFGSAAALLTLAAPTLAKNSSANSHTAKATEAPAPSYCHAYQQAGRWLVDATALSGDGCQGADPAPLRRKERNRRNAVTASGCDRDLRSRRPVQPIVKTRRHDPRAVVRHQRAQRERRAEIRHVGA